MKKGRPAGIDELTEDEAAYLLRSQIATHQMHGRWLTAEERAHILEMLRNHDAAKVRDAAVGLHRNLDSLSAEEREKRNAAILRLLRKSYMKWLRSRRQGKMIGQGPGRPKGRVLDPGIRFWRAFLMLQSYQQGRASGLDHRASIDKATRNVHSVAPKMRAGDGLVRGVLAKEMGRRAHDVWIVSGTAEKGAVSRGSRPKYRHKAAHKLSFGKGSSTKG